MVTPNSFSIWLLRLSRYLQIFLNTSLTMKSKTRRISVSHMWERKDTNMKIGKLHRNPLLVLHNKSSLAHCVFSNRACILFLKRMFHTIYLKQIYQIIVVVNTTVLHIKLSIPVLVYTLMKVQQCNKMYIIKPSQTPLCIVILTQAKEGISKNINDSI